MLAFIDCSISDKRKTTHKNDKLNWYWRVAVCWQKKEEEEEKIKTKTKQIPYTDRYSQFTRLPLHSHRKTHRMCECMRAIYSAFISSACVLCSADKNDYRCCCCCLWSLLVQHTSTHKLVQLHTLHTYFYSAKNSFYSRYSPKTIWFHEVFYVTFIAFVKKIMFMIFNIPIEFI